MQSKEQQGCTRVWPGLENAVRAVLAHCVEGGFPRWNPTQKDQNVPLVVANGPDKLARVGTMNHGTGRLEPVSPRQVSLAALSGVRCKLFLEALQSLSYAALDEPHGVLVWYDDDCITEAYAPLEAVYEAVRAVLTGEFK